MKNISLSLYEDAPGMRHILSSISPHQGCFFIALAESIGSALPCSLCQRQSICLCSFPIASPSAQNFPGIGAEMLEAEQSNGIMDLLTPSCAGHGEEKLPTRREALSNKSVLFGLMSFKVLKWNRPTEPLKIRNYLRL